MECVNSVERDRRKGIHERGLRRLCQRSDLWPLAAKLRRASQHCGTYLCAVARRSRSAADAKSAVLLPGIRSTGQPDLTYS